MLVLAASAGVAVTPVNAAPATSPPGQVVIVTTNLQEAYGEKDVKDPRDLDVYVARLMTLLPAAPDVLLLQEMRRSSARSLASRLSTATGFTYRVAVEPARNPHVQRNGRIHKRETAIVLNTSTMAKVDRGGFIRLDIPRDEMAAGLKPVTKYAARLLVRERGTGLKVPVVSIHLPLSSEFRSDSIANSRRGRFAKKVVRILKERYTGLSPRLDTVAGDFNENRFIGDTERIQPFYKVFTQYNNYRDALVVLKQGYGVDLIFTRAGIMAGDRDDSYNTKTTDPDEFYSDHQLRWMTLSPDVTPPSGASDLSARWSDSTIVVDWTHAIDNVGIARYEVWRKGGDVWRHRATVSSDGWVDPEVYSNKTYTYRVVPVDTSHNWGPSSNLADAS